VLLGQGYRTPRGAVIDGYGPGGMMTGAQGAKSSRKNVLQWLFVHHESHLFRPRLKTVLRSKEPESIGLSYGTPQSY
jgi:hypothetical protein